MISLPYVDPPDPDLLVERTDPLFGFAATVLPFWAIDELHAHGFASFRVAVPLGVGFICFVALMLIEYHKRDSLSPVKKMWTTVPVCGTLTAMIGGGVFVTYVMLLIRRLIRIDHWTPLAADLMFWPQVAGALLTAALLGLLLGTRFLPVLTLSGMLLLIPGGALLVQYARTTAASICSPRSACSAPARRLRMACSCPAFRCRSNSSAASSR